MSSEHEYQRTVRISDISLRQRLYRPERINIFTEAPPRRREKSDILRLQLHNKPKTNTVSVY
jgi:hypothetical protein